MVAHLYVRREGLERLTDLEYQTSLDRNNVSVYYFLYTNISLKMPLYKDDERARTYLKSLYAEKANWQRTD